VPYHYGTWYLDPDLGWVWVPGYVWAPAWVVFRTGPDYIGWTPVAPGFSIGMSFDAGAYSGPFVYVSTSHFCAPSVGRYVVPEAQARTIVRRTRIVNNLTIQNNIVVNRGPDPGVIGRASGRSIRAVKIESVPRAAPGGRGFSRASLAVEPQGRWHGIRATEPVSRHQPLPQSRAHERGNAHSNDGHAGAHPPAREARSRTHEAPSSRHHVVRRAPSQQHQSAHPAPGEPQARAAKPGKPHDGKPHDGKPHDGKPHAGDSHHGHPHDR
jgi:hypothetical protein